MDDPLPIPAAVDLSQWLEPRSALNLVQAKVASLDGALEWIVERLRANRIIAAAGSVRIRNQDYLRVLMPASYWSGWAYLAPDVMDFWNGGDVTLWANPNSLIGRFFDVRFDPAGFAPPFPAAPAPPAARPDNRKPLPSAEYGNASRAIVEGWGTTITEDRAVEMAKGLFPNHQVGRDPFLAQYRVIRGPKKRGKQSLRGE